VDTHGQVYTAELMFSNVSFTLIVHSKLRLLRNMCHFYQWTDTGKVYTAEELLQLVLQEADEHEVHPLHAVALPSPQMLCDTLEQPVMEVHCCRIKHTGECVQESVCVRESVCVYVCLIVCASVCVGERQSVCMCVS